MIRAIRALPPNVSCKATKLFAHCNSPLSRVSTHTSDETLRAMLAFLSASPCDVLNSHVHAGREFVRVEQSAEMTLSLQHEMHLESCR